MVDDEIYPQLIGELYNTEFPIKTKEKSRWLLTLLVRPIYKTEKINIKKPCIMTDKIYSQDDNSLFPFLMVQLF
ncbi:hypothetical protein B1B04_09275 [Lysinibacillus sp. KCTC 33748]|nr:hypothetical protein B1B04_09275 [Lysinibacillus sp. KCTC 33748]